LTKDERSHARPVALDEGESGLPALADAVALGNMVISNYRERPAALSERLAAL